MDIYEWLDARIKKLHLGCGKRIIPGYLNVDINSYEDVFEDDCMYLDNLCACLTRNFGYSAERVDLIKSFHLIEHLPRPKGSNSESGRTPNVETALTMWHHVLKKGGRLVIECPDLDQVIKEYVAGNKERINNIFGWNRFPGDVHCYGYSPDTLKELLERHNFVVTYVGNGTDYHTKFEPCMRIEAVKK